MPANSVSPKISFLGPVGSFTFKAAQSVASALQRARPETKIGLNAVASLPECYQNVESGVTELGIAPVENSTNGPVVLTWDVIMTQFRLRLSKNAGFRIVGEVLVPVKFSLLGYKKSQLPSVAANQQDAGEEPDISHIKHLVTHPQSWTQCTAFLACLPCPVTRTDAPSTSEAARIAAADHTGQTAALSAVRAAAGSGLEVLRRDVQDDPDNGTRFWLVARTDQQTEFASLLEAGIRGGDRPAGPHKALIVFRQRMSCETKQGGSIAGAFLAFDQPGVSLLRLFSRPSGECAWDLLYSAEIVVAGSSEASMVDKRYSAVKEMCDSISTSLSTLGFDSHCLGIWCSTVITADEA